MISEWIATISPISLVLTLIIVLVSIVYYRIKNKDLPPGPVGLPYIGYWPFLYSQDAHVQMQALRDKYGDVFSFTSFGRLYVNLGSVKALREAHIGKSECFAGRFRDFNVLGYVFKDGIAFLNGEHWKELRKFFLLVLKERGITSFKDSLSDSMTETIKSTVDLLNAKKEKPVNIVEIVNSKCNSILQRMLFGEDGISEEQMQESIKVYETVMQIMQPKTMTLTGDFPRYFILPFVNGFRKAMTNDKKMEKYLYEIIDEHKSVYNEENIRDVIDDFLKERNLRASRNDPTAQYFTDTALMSTFKQIVGDGVLAVGAFVFVTIKNLLDHPEEQERLYEEIIDVVGKDREPTIEDKSKLTYTNAFILESARTMNFIAYAPSLECTKETTLRGYRIPKGSITVMQHHICHYDPEVYEEPEKFNPTRYAVKDPKMRPEFPIAFGVGKRSCMGEGFAMMQVFLFLTTIVKNFELGRPEGQKLSTLEELMTGKLIIIARPRNQ